MSENKNNFKRRKEFPNPIAKSLVKELVKIGPDPEFITKLHKLPNLKTYSEEGLRNFISTTAGTFQKQATVKNTNDPNFRNINDWCDYLVSKGLDQDCNDTLAMAMKTVTFTENLPTVPGTKIDYKSLYEYITCTLKGYPTPVLNDDTMSILLKVHTELLKEINTVDFNQVENLLKEVFDEKKIDKSPHNSEFHTFLQEDEVNPFKIPYVLLSYDEGEKYEEEI